MGVNDGVVVRRGPAPWRSGEEIVTLPVTLFDMGYRTGVGHDVHRLVPGASLVLGGVVIEADVGFDTHSDGDVLCHAIIDALAGAIADGDLGTHFPEDDVEAAEASSLGFLREFRETVAGRGYVIENIDSFVVLGTVRLRPHIERMRDNVAEALQLDCERVSVKARSNDGLGLEGEGLACSAWATVLVYPVTSDDDTLSG